MIWENLGDDEEIVGFPKEFDEDDQISAARRAIEIAPCLEMVFKPLEADPSSRVMGGALLSDQERDLLTTEWWHQRPDLIDLQRVGEELADALEEQVPLPEIRFAPTAYFPTELAVIAERTPNVDLYALFN